MQRILHALAAAVALVLPLAAAAVDAPHDASFTSGDCIQCHKLHNATGTGLTNQPTNPTLCLSCHTAQGRSPRVKWLTTDQARPGVGGNQHSWDGATTNATYGAQPPTHPALLTRTPGAVLQCSTCHDLHKANALNTPGSVHASITPGTPQNHVAGTGTGRLTLQALGANPLPRGYRIKVVAGPGIILSHDFSIGSGIPSWLNWIGNAWVAGADGGAGKPFTPGTPVVLDDPAVSVALEANTASGDYWDFYVAYPFVRAYNAAGEMCIDCHRDRAQSHATVRGATGYGWSTGKAFSHPVGQGLRSNGDVYDRTAPLDANGAVQGAAGADANGSNDLVLSNGNVTCLTCHAPHNADSNSLSVDLR